jgi:CDP-6-deoxy-D-xylo-4-hexulose-3-dehydrase
MPESKEWQDVIASEWKARRAADPPEDKLFPLAMNPFGEEEILAMTEVLLTGRLTLGVNVEKAEKLFAEKVGAPYAVMVNSGSSANLLAVSAIVNKFRPVHAEVGDEVLVPAVAWSTSVFPLIQCGLRPVFVDADPVTFNVTKETLKKAMTPKTRAVMAVHVLGNSICMKDLEDFVKEHNLMLVEDTCESLGSTYIGSDGKMKMLGTLGDFGCYSFYFSHHITSGEGGMVTCKTEQDYNFVRCLRAHGWTRHLTNRKEVEAKYSHIDSRFLFVNLGYNLRPMEVQGAMLIVQLKKLDEFNAIRRDNLKRVDLALSKNPKYAKTMCMMRASEGMTPAWFGIAILLHEQYGHQLDEYLAYLTANGVENRPIISGNFIRQPSIAMYCKDEKPENYPGSETIHNRGFFIGVHQVHVEDEKIQKLAEIMLGFEFKEGVAEPAAKKAKTS